MKVVYLDVGWIPIAYDGAGNHLCLDLAPAEGGQVAQLVVFVHDDAAREVQAPSLAAWMQGLADALQQRRKVWDADLQAVEATAPAPADHGEVIRATVEHLMLALLKGENLEGFAVPGLGVVSLHVRKSFVGEMQNRPITVPGVRGIGFMAGPELARVLDPDRSPATGRTRSHRTALVIRASSGSGCPIRRWPLLAHRQEGEGATAGPAGVARAPARRRQGDPGSSQR